ncbi:hypothetical protein GGI35DRAFT_427642 [Trichoderma velutinum]
MFACLADPWLATALHPLYWQLTFPCFASKLRTGVSPLFCSAASKPPTASFFIFHSFFSCMELWQFSSLHLTFIGFIFFSTNANPPSFSFNRTLLRNNLRPANPCPCKFALFRTSALLPNSADNLPLGLEWLVPSTVAHQLLG